MDIPKEFEKEILEKLERLLERHSDSSFRGKKLTPDTRFEEDLRMDYPDRCEFGYYVGKELGIPISDEMIDKSKTVGDYLDCVYRREIFGRR